MDGIVTLEELFEALREAIEDTLATEGGESWTINASGTNFLDELEVFNLEDLQDLQTELQEGYKAEVTVDLSDVLLAHVNALVKEMQDEDQDEMLDEMDVGY